ncbi:hypothetical protein TWF481_005780 [Arthrobotrys musiformis]|uniref:J domain-containing protein n=1 Tax=Arthrobotrys musiformis TaxID=47236 RepID=A0AAV9WES5_9PEZI
MPREDVTIDHYAALEVSVTATSDEIKKQFRKLALKYHPDRNPGREAEFNAKFQQIQAAHELLTDPGRRKLYDRSRLHYNGNNKPKPDRYDTSTPSNEPAASSRKYTSNAHRSAYATGARPSDAHFSAKSQWDHASRTYTPGGASAWKAAQERWQQRSSREIPRTPKKTRENPYTSVDPEPPSTSESAYRFYKDDGTGTAGGKKSTRHGFFGDRNPREKEWMDPSSEHKPGGSYNRRSGGIWETKSSSEEDGPRQSTFYAFTPRTRLRTNLRDTSPDRPNPHGNNHQNGGYSAKPKTASPSDPAVSPQRSGVFTRPQTMRESKEHSDQTSFNQDRRKSNSSVGLEGTERRKFSYLFNEDGLRRPHRATKQNMGSDHDEENDGFPKIRNIPLRQSYPSSRRNTLDREGTASKGSGENRSNHGPKNQERQRFNGHSYGKSEDFHTPLNSFKSFETNASSPSSFPGSPPKEEPRPKSFSPSDWNTVFSGTENIFAPPFRKGSQSPRKGPALPKLQTSTNTGGTRWNFSRPRPTSTSEESPGAAKDIGLDEPSPRGDSPRSPEGTANTHDSDPFPQNAFVFEEWQKAFSETNPFNINPSHQHTSGSTARSTSKHRKTATTKRSAGSFTTQKVPITDNNNANSSASVTPTEKNGRPPPNEPSSAQKDVNSDANTSIPSPIAMDIDTPQKSPASLHTAPVTPIRQKPSTSKNLPTDHSPAVSEEDPVSPIRGDGVPISPLRPDEVPQRDNDSAEAPSLNLPGDAPPLRPNPRDIPSRGSTFPDLGSLRNMEPLSYASANGLNNHWQGLRDNLPFESKAAPFVQLSPAPEHPKNRPSPPKPPEAPTAPNEISLTSYDKYCAQMTVYQAHWNEYNGKIVNHLRARLDTDILQCAQNKGFATGTSTDPETGIRLDLKQTMKAISELDEDRKIRAEWETSIGIHKKALIQWKSYLESLEAAGFA